MGAAEISPAFDQDIDFLNFTTHDRTNYLRLYKPPRNHLKRNKKGRVKPITRCRRGSRRSWFRKEFIRTTTHAEWRRSSSSRRPNGRRQVRARRPGYAARHERLGDGRGAGVAGYV